MLPSSVKDSVQLYSERDTTMCKLWLQNSKILKKLTFKMNRRTYPNFAASSFPEGSGIRNYKEIQTWIHRATLGTVRSLVGRGHLAPFPCAQHSITICGLYFQWSRNFMDAVRGVWVLWRSAGIPGGRKLFNDTRR